ncbi:PX domain-containing protein [Phytophthora infestans]|uniref:PX domain-containing protein n=1 Tax=Phytophthora infestans TaxID=4787 RepID=A0A8S9TNI1_PHYIN|nr:PX domain-containing protein [Phytophthora infestans]
MRLSDAMCASNTPMRSTESTCSSLDEVLRQSIFPADPFGRPVRTRASSRKGGKFPRLLWRCSMSARNLLSRDRSGGVPNEGRRSLRRHTHCSLASATPRSSTTSDSRSSHRPTSREPSMTPRSSTVVLRESSEDLLLFREEAEYSEYLLAHVTGQHIERAGDNVVFYEVEVHLSKNRWRVVRRFSEFRALRQQLIKHFSRGKRRRQPRCPICENVLASILDIDFPSRQVWGSHIFSSSSADAHEDEIINERKARFQQFVVMCLNTLRSLRQHVRVKPDSADCEISVVSRMIEEFLGLSFTRYLAFLGERGIVDQASETSRQSLPARKEDRAVFNVKYKEVM